MVALRAKQLGLHEAVCREGDWSVLDSYNKPYPRKTAKDELIDHARAKLRDGVATANNYLKYTTDLLSASLPSSCTEHLNLSINLNRALGPFRRPPVLSMSPCVPASLWKACSKDESENGEG